MRWRKRSESGAEGPTRTLRIEIVGFEIERAIFEDLLAPEAGPAIAILEYFASGPRPEFGDGLEEIAHGDSFRILDSTLAGVEVQDDLGASGEGAKLVDGFVVEGVDFLVNVIFVNEHGRIILPDEGEVHMSEERVQFDVLRRLKRLDVERLLAEEDDLEAFILGECKGNSAMLRVDLTVRSGRWRLLRTRQRRVRGPSDEDSGSDDGGTGYAESE